MPSFGGLTSAVHTVCVFETTSIELSVRFENERYLSILFGLIGFYGISIDVGDLMSDPAYTYISNI